MFSRLFVFFPVLTVCLAAALPTEIPTDTPSIIAETGNLTYGLTNSEILDLKHDYPSLEWDEILSAPPSGDPAPDMLIRRKLPVTGQIHCGTDKNSPWAVDVFRMAANLFVESAAKKCFQNNGITNIMCTWMSFHKTAGVKICSKKKYLGGYQYCKAIGQDILELAKRCKRGVKTAGVIGYPNRHVWAEVVYNPAENGGKGWDGDNNPGDKTFGSRD